MNPAFFKPLRVCLALACFMPIVFLFLDLYDTGIRGFAGNLLFFQFVPSLLTFIHQAAVASAGVLAVLILTLVLGRVYCSVLCPLGVFQDIVARVFRISPKGTGKRTKRAGYTFSQPHNRLRYSLLGVTVLVFALGSPLVLTLLDPFSSFGRILAHLAHPLVVGLNNLAVPILESMDNHLLFRVKWNGAAPPALSIAAATFVLVTWMAARHGRLYCNTLCPVGALLGLFSKGSVFKFAIDPEHCTGCGRCQRACKAGCIDVKTGKVDESRCVSCFNCLGACPDQAMVFKPIRGRARLDPGKSSRRGFMAAMAAGSLGLVAKPGHALPPGAKPLQSRPTTIPETRNSALSPPGSRGIGRYTGRCTACHLCVTACPSRVLVPSITAFGLSGIFQPQMEFSAGHCNYACTVCSQVCPTGAILPVAPREKKVIQVGVAKFIKENCVVYTDLVDCGACSEHCPTKAVDMVPYANPAGKPLVIPKMNEAICVGCGGCEYACPTKPYKAIYVDGNPVHQTAEKPKEKKLEIKIQDDFPF